MVISEISQLILTSIILTLVYWISYFLSRRKLYGPGKTSEIVFALNLLLGVFLIGGYQLHILRVMDILVPLTIAAAVVMTISILAHHLSIFAIDRKSKRKIVYRLHGAISHLLFSVSFGVNYVAMGSKYLSTLQTTADRMVFLIFLLLAASSVVGTFFVGLGKLKLPYQ